MFSIMHRDRLLPFFQDPCAAGHAATSGLQANVTGGVLAAGLPAELAPQGASRWVWRLGHSVLQYFSTVRNRPLRTLNGRGFEGHWATIACSHHGFAGPCSRGHERRVGRQ